MIDATTQFAIGEKVMLNSGSPELTVTAVDEQVAVEWLDESTKRTATFPAACLTPVQARGK